MVTLSEDAAYIHLPTLRNAGGVSLTTTLLSDPFNKGSDVSSIILSYTASEVNLESRNSNGAKITYNNILSTSRPLIKDLLRGIDSLCEQAKGLIESRIVVTSRPLVC